MTRQSRFLCAPLSAIGNTGNINAIPTTNSFTISDNITDGLDASNAGDGAVYYVANNLYVTPTSGSIQRGVNSASTGDTINVEAGTYTENDTINKQITLSGASSANTTIQSAVGNTPVIAVTGSGADATHLLTIEGLKRTGLPLAAAIAALAVSDSFRRPRGTSGFDSARCRRPTAAMASISTARPSPT